MNDLQRFIDRIGKRIYRDATDCPCCICECVTKEWLIIDDESHANLLFDYQNEMWYIYSAETKKIYTTE